MNSKKWIFSTLLVLSAAAHASSTRVGNGDDGRDLEAVKPIQSGVLFETRAEALATLKKLNIPAVAGLGQLVPELEHTDLLMAKSDVPPLAAEGGWERSEDGSTVYARTFAEAHAPTRFFPATLKLSREQLVALHIHEALHRALPPGARENEDKVALLTMAITSPAATFDRVNRVAMDSLREPASQPEIIAPPAAATSTANVAVEKPAPPPIKSEWGYDHTTYSSGKFGGFLNVERLVFNLAPFGTFEVGKLQAAAKLSLEGLYIFDSGQHFGPASVIGKIPVYLTNERTFGPILRVSFKSLEGFHGSDDQPDRDVYSVGAFYEDDQPNGYSKVAVTYTFPGTYNRYSDNGLPPDGDAGTIHLGPIWSAYMHEGFKFKRFSFGAVADFHHGHGFDMFPQDTFSILRAGPEIKWSNGHSTLSFALETALNRPGITMDELGDVAGHGSGMDSATLAFTHEM